MNGVPLERAREQMRELGLWSPRQQMGRRWTMGCVALEVTERYVNRYRDERIPEDYRVAFIPTTGR